MFLHIEKHNSLDDLFSSHWILFFAHGHHLPQLKPREDLCQYVVHWTFVFLRTKESN